MKVTGSSAEVSLDERAITEVVFESETPKAPNARATELGLSVKVYGRMLFDLRTRGNDPTLGLAQWSQVASHNSDCYRKVEIDIISASQVVRKFTLPEAFVVEYKEELDDETGVGDFYLHVRQKRDENAEVKIDGGFAAD